MDAYFVKEKPGTAAAKAKKAEQNKFGGGPSRSLTDRSFKKPYERHAPRTKASLPSTADDGPTAGPSRLDDRPVAGSAPQRSLVPRSSFHSSSHRAAVKRISSTLKDPKNKICNSDSYEKTVHVVSCASGHQQSNGGMSRDNSKAWGKSRMAKLRAQAEDKETDVLQGVCVYINGYTSNRVTNQELYRIIERAGGTWRPVLSFKACTHIVTSGPLSMSKQEEEIQRKRNGGCLIVSPDWVLESVQAGKRLPEWKFKVLEHDTQKSIITAYATRPSTSAEASDASPSTQIIELDEDDDATDACPPRSDDEGALWDQVGDLPEACAW